MLISLVPILSCSQKDDVKPSYDSQLTLYWEGIGFPVEDEPKCDLVPCACYETFSVTISKVIVRRLDVESEPFDLLEGESVTFDSKEYIDGNTFKAPGTTWNLDPGRYELMSITVDAVEAGPDLNGDVNMNQELNAALPAEAYLILYMGDYCDRTFNLQEGWHKQLIFGFSCEDSVYYNRFTQKFVFDPVIYCSEPHCL
jgi:hypothetical protein